MNHFRIDQKLMESIMDNLKEKGFALSLEEVSIIVDFIKEEVLFRYMD